MRSWVGALILSHSFIAFALAQSATQPGEAVYRQHCALCHDSSAIRVPTRAALQQLTAFSIERALDSGVMKQQAASLSFAERTVVSSWLGRKTTSPVGAAQQKNFCTGSRALRAVKGQTPSNWTSWGGGLGNLRFQSAADAGLKAGDAAHLELAWAFGVPDVTMLRSQPAVFEGRVLFGGGGTVYALDAETGCTYWATEVPAAVRTGVTVGSPAGRPLAFFGDEAANVFALDARTGSPVWQTNVGTHPAAVATGTPVYYKNRLYVSVASFEEVLAASPNYPCCTFRGSISALDAQTGKSIWRTFTINEPAKEQSSTKSGAKILGPSGAGIWSSPTIDPERGVLYVTTGDNYSDPPSGTSDAVLAVSLDTGEVRWSRQMRAGDTWNASCSVPEAKSCPDAPGPDFDFGAPPILTALQNGKRELVVAQKSGDVYALDPDEQGKVLWKSQVGSGGILGGIEWGAAADAERLFVAISDQGFLPPVPGSDMELDPTKGGGVFALRLANGERLWMTAPSPCDEHRHPCSPAQPGPVTATPGLVFAGSLNGHLRIYSADSGSVLWDFDTARDFQTVNGVPAHGGSLNAAGPVVVNGTVYALSGYNFLGGSPGNVLLAFRAKLAPH